MSLLNFFSSIETDSQDINLWVSGCPHCPADTPNGRASIGLPLSQIDAGAFDFDLGIMLGDFENDQDPPTLANTTQGEDCSGQLNSSAIYDRAKIYTMAGNHDAGDANMDWFLRYIDPLGDNTSYSGVNSSNMPYPQTLMEAGSWHSYYITVNNVRIFILSDRNELPEPWGRGGHTETGGYPSGTLTVNTWNWVKNVMETGTNYNYIICTHANPRFTTIATPDGDRACGNHGASGIPAGSGSLYSLYDEDTPANSEDATSQYLDYFAANPNHTCVMWLGSHTHTVVDSTCGTGLRGSRWTENGVVFQNIANLTYYHARTVELPIDPKSWLLNINSNRINCKMYIHEITESAGLPVGFYAPEEFNVSLKV